MKKILINEERAKQYAQLADGIADKITPEQLEVLKYDSYGLDNEDEERMYHGAGFGWVEFSPLGHIVDMQYASREVGLEDEGSKEPNICNYPFSKKDVMPKILTTGNIRVLVNFSRFELQRF
ncbi:MAG: hypothetical protein PHT07_10720 [Paludibacter sp.]|nr:hypothetical protein [Paludibacter sp.]